MRTSQDKHQLKQFQTTMPALWEILKGALNTEWEKGDWRRMGFIEL